ncbi:MAG TPA: phospho-sugar mutase [Flavobacteriaceae bacterium]|nr:phospho-sugar mutase [Flavobacteriaceae bacterium]
MKEILNKAKSWLTDAFDDDTREQVQILIDNDDKELQESFYQDLKFGTGGMRGIMGVGSNRINKYTLGKNTQGIANQLKKDFPGEQHKVAIAYDCRHNSKELAEVVAGVFSANDVQVYLFSELRPTPELSFAVKQLDCHCGIVLTASHNPPEYNGYKVYWQDGGQLVTPKDEEVVQEIAKVDFKDIRFEAKSELITKIDQEIDEAFIKEAVEQTSFGATAEAKANLNIVFTSLHGTSITIAPKAFEKAGFSQVHIVEEQAEPNGDFPTVKSPNPEEPEALEMALNLAEKKNADIVIGTDPDADRLGVAVRDLDNKLVLLNGNQTMVMMTDFLLKKHQEKGFKGNEFIGSTIVSTPLMSVLGEAYEVDCKLGLTGFKWIAKMIKDHPDQKFIGGGEESFGFMVGDFVRDKDSISSILLACEIAAIAKDEGSSFYEELLKLYIEHGVYQEHLVSLVKKGIEGAEEIKAMMKELRENPPKEFDGIKVAVFEDYQTSERTHLKTGEQSKIIIPKSNVLIFYLEDGSKIAARPSGTEPKIKFYVSVKGEMKAVDEYPKVQQELNDKTERLLQKFDF